MKIAPLILAFFLMLGYFQPALAFRCDGRIISTRSFSGEIQRRCREPMSINKYLDYKIIAIQHTQHRTTYRQLEFITVPINVEEWIYNLGPNDLMRQLRFENGKLIEITTLGYGY